MMKVEGSFAKMDLSSLKEAPIKLFAKACVQYQDYKTKVAISRIDYKSTGWSESTAVAMFDTAVAYIKYGSRPENGVASNLIKAVDEVIASNRYRALIPAKSDARKVLPRKSKVTSTIEVPVVRKSVSTPISVNPIKAIQEFLYAVSSNNIFYTFKSESEVNSFVQGVKFANPSADIKVQKISIVED